MLRLAKEEHQSVSLFTVLSMQFNLDIELHNFYFHLAEEDTANPFVEIFTIILTSIFVILTFPLTIWFCFKVVQEYERAVIFRLGRLKKGGPRGPGIFFVMPCIDSYTKVDLRTVSFDVPPQEVLTKDSVTVCVDAVVYYKICDPLNAVVAVSNYR